MIEICEILKKIHEQKIIRCTILEKDHDTWLLCQLLWDENMPIAITIRDNVPHYVSAETFVDSFEHGTNWENYIPTYYPTIEKIGGSLLKKLDNKLNRFGVKIGKRITPMIDTDEDEGGPDYKEWSC